MVKHVTVVAKNPPKDGSACSGSDDDAPWMTAAIDAVLKKNPQMVVLRAAHVEQLSVEIENVLKAFPGQQLSLQIISHGLSGLLNLGSSFWLEALPACAFNDPYYFLDSNPWSLGYLMEARGKLDKLILNACFVGRNEDEGFSINGRTLGYTLCELYQADVIAAIDETEPDELDANGEYSPKPEHLKPVSWKWTNQGPIYNDPNPDQNLKLKQKTATLDIVATKARMLIPSSKGKTHLVELPGMQMRLKEIVAPGLLHARPEVVLTTDQGDTVHLLCNARLARTGGKLYEVLSSTDAAKRLATVLR